MKKKSRAPRARREQTKTNGKRGAQQGNLNALKHGFYSRHFNIDESNDLAAAESIDLENEVKMLRVAIRRVMKNMKEDGNFVDQTVQLDALGMGAVRLSHLLKVKHFLNGGAGNLDTALEQVLTEVLEEMK